MYGYDSFVLEDNQYGESFYTDMTDSIQIKKIEPVPTTPAVPAVPQAKSSFTGGRYYVPQVPLYNDYTKELQQQIYIFYILLVAAVIIIVMQRMTINTLQNFVFSKVSTVLSDVSGV